MSNEQHQQPNQQSSMTTDQSLGEQSATQQIAPSNDAARQNLQESASFPYTAFIDHDQRRPHHLTPHEIALLRELLRTGPAQGGLLPSSPGRTVDMTALTVAESTDSDYPGFGESTHAWAIFADNPKKRAGMLDRVVGILIMLFQLFTYWMFASEAIEDYQSGQVAVTTQHGDCLAADEEPDQNFVCEAGFTNDFDAFIAFFMLGIFLAGDFIQAFKVIRLAQGSSVPFACLAAVEVFSAFLSASISVSYNLYIGEVTDAVEVGVGLLFIRELSQRAYVGIRDGEVKQYKIFFSVLAVLVAFGMMMDPLCERLFAVKEASH